MGTGENAHLHTHTDIHLPVDGLEVHVLCEELCLFQHVQGGVDDELVQVGGVVVGRGLCECVCAGG